MTWTSAHIVFVGVPTDDPIVTADITTPAGMLKVMARVTWIARKIQPAP